MNARRIALSIVGLLLLSVSARAGPVTVFTDSEAFRAAAGPLMEIDFSTLPDGTPSPNFMPIEITPEFNYDHLGVRFSSAAPSLFIVGNVTHDLLAVSKSGIRNWIEADFEPQVFAIGFTDGAVFGPLLSIFDADDQLLAESRSINGFIGMISDDPIDLAVIDENSNGVAITSILFQPVPEPVTLVLLGAGAYFMVRRSRAHKTQAAVVS